MAYLGWPDDQIMACDMARLDLAITARIKAIDEDRRFQMQIHGIKVGGHRPPPKNGVEQDERVKEAFAELGTVKVRRGAKAA